MGMLASPVKVGSHFETMGLATLDPTASFDALTMRLIVAPGIRTLARVCHRSVSTTTVIAGDGKAASEVFSGASAAARARIPAAAASDRQ
eukprot:CAMPEP_0194327968 /NCGR_PEP_ID=MMETSP0171-20130528/43200_1 /TAXON_ID=218684 /ORGANISM="Corethron pennatum, Strain L29A3" /LENGTH=89 /DNA_ID=CAMNT_0039088117 /DNA_START=66 /DNA_END=335 /DNA_ORIENTATION=-